jgi:hypothetical protein
MKMSQRNYNQSTIDVIADIQLGIMVTRAAAAMAAALTPIFTIVGGPVLMTAFFGKITVASGANNVHLEATPTTGTSIPVAANLDINPALVGDYLTITGIGSDAMTYNASATGLPMMNYKGFILPVGTLDYHAVAADGSASWTLFYVPLETGAYVTAT